MKWYWWDAKGLMGLEYARGMGRRAGETGWEVRH